MKHTGSGQGVAVILDNLDLQHENTVINVRQSLIRNGLHFSTTQFILGCMTHF
jgi:hypothetical protein